MLWGRGQLVFGSLDWSVVLPHDDTERTHCLKYINNDVIVHHDIIKPEYQYLENGTFFGKYRPDNRPCLKHLRY